MGSEFGKIFILILELGSISSELLLDVLQKNVYHWVFTFDSLYYIPTCNRKNFHYIYCKSLINLAIEVLSRNLTIDTLFDIPTLTFSLLSIAIVDFIPAVIGNSVYFYHVKKCLLKGNLNCRGTSLKALALPILVLILSSILPQIYPLVKKTYFLIKA